MSDTNKIASIMNRSIGSSERSTKFKVKPKVDKKVWFRCHLDKFFILCNEYKKYIFNTILAFGCILVFVFGYFVILKILTPNHCLDEDICKVEELLTANGKYDFSDYYIHTNDSYANFLHYVEKCHGNNILVYTKDGIRLKIDPEDIIIKNNGKKTLFYDTNKKIWVLNY